MTSSNDHDDTVKHLEFIQAIIARQAANSFLLKGWSITLVAGLFALASKDANSHFVWLALLPTLGFGCLDAYYLHQEKRFRLLFDWVRRGRAGMTNEELRDIGPFCLNPNCVPQNQTPKGAISVWRVLLAPSLWLFYGLILAGTLLVAHLGAR